VQTGIRGQAGTADISGIPVDFRRNQDNMALYLSVIFMKWIFAQFCRNNETDRFQVQACPGATTGGYEEILTFNSLDLPSLYFSIPGLGQGFKVQRVKPKATAHHINQNPEYPIYSIG
jgi:hypothetical protein